MGIKSSILSRSLACAASSIVIAAAAAPAYAQEQNQQINIEAQSLGGAVNALARQTGAIIIAPSELVEGKTSQTLSGTFTAEAALTRLLAGSGLEARRDGSGNFVLRRVAASAAREASAGVEEQAESVAVDEIIVIGSFARGLQSSIETKRNADSIVDAVNAEDIGNFPASNVAEALQRIPGVTIGRNAGEGNLVSVRGLGPIFQSVTVNGVPIAFNENVRNSGQSGREFRFQILPADLIAGISVTKSPTADLIEGGIGSNIDVRTFRPLEQPSFVSARVHATYEDLSEEITPNGSISASWRTSDNTFGLIGGVSYGERNVQFDNFEFEGYASRNVGGEQILVPGDIRATGISEDRKRLSAFGGAQWQLSDAVSVNLDLLYAGFENSIVERRIVYEIGSNASGAALTNPTIDRTATGTGFVGVLTGGTINGGRIQNNTEFSEQQHDNFSAKLSADIALGSWKITPTLSYSLAESELPIPLQRVESRTTSAAGLSYTFDFANAVEQGSLNALTTSLDLTNPAAIPFNRVTSRPISSNDRDYTVLLDIERDLDVDLGSLHISALKLGGQYSDRARDYDRRDRSAVARPGTVVDGSFFDQTSPSNGFGNIVGTGPIVHTVANYDLFRGAFRFADFDGLEPSPDDLVPTNADLQNSYFIGEEIAALYGRLDFMSDVLGAELKGDIGVRWVSTDSLIEGTQLTAQLVNGVRATVAAPAEFSNSYSEFLPNLNLNFSLSDEIVLRLGLSRTMTRPSLADLRTALVPNSGLVLDVFERGQDGITNPSPGSSFVGIAGNPKLEPYLSNNIDASLEWYFSDFGALTVSPFYKEISNFIGSSSRIEQIPLATRTGETVVGNLAITRPTNIGEATISGIEFGYADRLPSGFGLAASLTLADSTGKLALPTGTISAPLQGVSDLSYSISPFFERHGFQVHLAYTYRSEFVRGGTVAPSTGRQFVTDSYATLDFGASYEVVEGLTAFVEGVNLTNSVSASYEGDEFAPRQIGDAGRSFNFGVRAKF